MLRSLLPLLVLAAVKASAAAGSRSIADYPSIQAALDANPGKVMHVPAGDHVVTEKIRLRTHGCGLEGPGRIIQQNAEAPILEIQADEVRVCGLTLTRPDEKQETHNGALIAIKCGGLALDDLRVVNNRSNAPAISVRESHGVRISRCLVRNYMRVAVDDRTASPHYGYAFKCIDGTGIGVSYSTSVLIEGNRVMEEQLLPTPEVQKAHDLGRFVKKAGSKGSIVSQKAWDAEYVDNWHQGSAIIVTAPEVSDSIRILGNAIENAAQGIDIHADHVIIQGNIVNNAFIGMKAMHGSRNVLIIGNQFIRNDLWSIGLMPGAAAHPATDAGPANADGGSIIANNIISDFGHGHAHWIWKDQGTPLRFDEGQEPDDPPLRDVVVQGNVVFNSGADAKETEDGAPRYRYAVRLPAGLEGLHFSSNLFHPGKDGVSNRPLPP
jgi:hypothetical protein